MLSNPIDQIHSRYPARMECVYANTMVLDTNGIGQLYLTAPGETVPQDILAIFRAMYAAPINLCRVFPEAPPPCLQARRRCRT